MNRRPLLACLLLTLPLAASLAGCMLFESKATRAMVASPDYKAGYSDGCASASSYDASHRHDTDIRDDDLYASSKAYHSGWGSGFGACRSLGNSGGMMQPSAAP